SVPDATFLPCAINENAAHSLCRGAEEMSPILPIVVLADEPNPCLMDQRRRLKGLSAGFLGHASVCKLPQFLVDERQKFLRCLRVARFNTAQQLSDVGHGAILEPMAGNRNCELIESTLGSARKRTALQAIKEARAGFQPTLKVDFT